MARVEVSNSNIKGKKYKIVLYYDDGRKKTVHIGQAGAEDYTIHKDEERKERYIDRHETREDWSKGGMETPAYWAKHLLWNKPTLSKSIEDIKKRHGYKSITLKRT